MHRTLVFIPHDFAGLPVLGLGWALILLAIALAVRLVLAGSHGQSIGKLIATEGPMWCLAAFTIAFLLPHVELKNAYGEPIGMAIRGYGVMLLTGVVSASAKAVGRKFAVGM